MSSQKNEIFIRYFKCNLKKLIITQYADKGVLKNDKLPQDYLVNHISSSFVETVGWWISGKMKESPEQITQYFLAVIEPILQKPENGGESRRYLSFRVIFRLTYEYDWIIIIIEVIIQKQIGGF